MCSSALIKSYEIWNEANLKTFWNGTPEEMAELTKRAYDIIKKIDPAAQVVSASPSTRLASSFTTFYPAYLKALAAKNWPVDVMAIHTYPTASGDPVERGVAIKAVQEYNVLAREFPSNLTAMMFSYAVKPTFTVANEAAISAPPPVSFDKSPAPAAAASK